MSHRGADASGPGRELRPSHWHGHGVTHWVAEAVLHGSNPRFSFATVQELLVGTLLAVTGPPSIMPVGSTVTQAQPECPTDHGQSAGTVTRGPCGRPTVTVTARPAGE
jgi:hypothetical protein